MEGYFTPTSPPALANSELPGTLPPHNSGPSCPIYEIIMVSLSGSILLLAVIVLALQMIRNRVRHFQRQSKLGASTQVFSDADVVVPNIIVKHNDGEEVLTAEIIGPACIGYVSEKRFPLCEVLPSKKKAESDAVSFISFLTPLDTSPKQ